MEKDWNRTRKSLHWRSKTSWNLNLLRRFVLGMTSPWTGPSTVERVMFRPKLGRSHDSHHWRQWFWLPWLQLELQGVLSASRITGGMTLFWLPCEMKDFHFSKLSLRGDARDSMTQEKFGVSTTLPIGLGTHRCQATLIRTQIHALFRLVKGCQICETGELLYNVCFLQSTVPQNGVNW